MAMNDLHQEEKQKRIVFTNEEMMKLMRKIAIWKDPVSDYA